MTYNKKAKFSKYILQIMILQSSCATIYATPKVEGILSAAEIRDVKVLNQPLKKFIAEVYTEGEFTLSKEELYDFIEDIVFISTGGVKNFLRIFRYKIYISDFIEYLFIPRNALEHKYIQFENYGKRLWGTNNKKIDPKKIKKTLLINDFNSLKQLVQQKLEKKNGYLVNENKNFRKNVFINSLRISNPSIDAAWVEKNWNLFSKKLFTIHTICPITNRPDGSYYPLYDEHPLYPSRSSDSHDNVLKLDKLSKSKHNMFMINLLYKLFSTKIEDNITPDDLINYFEEIYDKSFSDILVKLRLSIINKLKTDVKTIQEKLAINTQSEPYKLQIIQTPARNGLTFNETVQTPTRNGLTFNETVQELQKINHADVLALALKHLPYQDKPAANRYRQRLIDYLKKQNGNLVNNLLNLLYARQISTISTQQEISAAYEKITGDHILGLFLFHVRNSTAKYFNLSTNELTKLVDYQPSSATDMNIPNETKTEENITKTKPSSEQNKEHTIKTKPKSEKTTEANAVSLQKYNKTLSQNYKVFILDLISKDLNIANSSLNKLLKVLKVILDEYSNLTAKHTAFTLLDLLYNNSTEDLNMFLSEYIQQTTIAVEELTELQQLVKKLKLSIPFKLEIEPKEIRTLVLLNEKFLKSRNNIGKVFRNNTSDFLAQSGAQFMITFLDNNTNTTIRNYLLTSTTTKLEDLANFIDYLNKANYYEQHSLNFFYYLFKKDALSTFKYASERYINTNKSTTSIDITSELLDAFKVFVLEQLNINENEINTTLTQHECSLALIPI